MRIFSDFDSGSLQSAKVEGDHVILTPRPHPFNGRATSLWNFFCVEGAAGRTLRFSFDHKDCYMHGHNEGNLYQVSDDGVSWRVVDSAVGDTETYSFMQKMTSDRMWFAHHMPYTTTRLDEQVSKWLNSPYVTPTNSADENGRMRGDDGAVWLTPGGKNEEGYRIPQHPLYALQITEDAQEDLPTVMIVGGVHSGEHNANYVIEGLVQWMIQDESQCPEAAELRRRCRMLVYPMVDPDGRYGGYTRGNQIIPDGDHNRMWSQTDDGMLVNMDRLKQAMREDRTSEVAFYIDVHNQMKPDQQYMYINTDIMHHPGTKDLLPFPATMEKEVQGFTMRASDSYIIESHNTTGKTWGCKGTDGPQARYSYTMEPGSIPQPQPEISYHYGRAIGLGLLAGLCHEWSD